MTHHADYTSYGLSLTEAIIPRHFDRAGLGSSLRGKHAQQGGFAGAIGPKENYKLAPTNRKVQVPEHRPIAVAFVQPFHTYGFSYGSASLIARQLLPLGQVLGESLI